MQRDLRMCTLFFFQGIWIHFANQPAILCGKHWNRPIPMPFVSWVFQVWAMSIWTPGWFYNIFSWSDATNFCPTGWEGNCMRAATVWEWPLFSLQDSTDRTWASYCSTKWFWTHTQRYMMLTIKVKFTVMVRLLFKSGGSILFKMHFAEATTREELLFASGIWLIKYGRYYSLLSLEKGA